METIRKTLGLLSPRERKRLWLLLSAITLMALMQVAGIASITPFLTLVGNPDIIESNRYLAWAYTTFGFTSRTAFLIATGVGGLLVLIVSNAFTALTTWFMLRYSWGIYHTLSKRLLESYLRQPYEFFLNRNTSDLSKNMLSEAGQVVRSLLVPAMQMLAKLMVIVFILALLVAVDPLLALLSITGLGGAYGLIFLFVRRRLSVLGAAKVKANRARFHAAVEALGGAKEVKLLGKERFFIERYSRASKEFSRFTTATQVIGQIPRYGLEAMAFGGMFLIVIYQLLRGQDPGQVLPIIALYGFALYRLMPALQQVFSSMADVRSTAASLDTVYDDLGEHPGGELPVRRSEPLPFRESIELRDVTFRYSGASEPVLKGFDLKIEANSSIAFVGATGSGKTTTVDLLLGLLRPQQGSLVIDGEPVDDDKVPSWQRNLGYVPQQIYLNDDTVANNIAFGVAEKHLDRDAVIRAAKMADIHDFIVDELPDGYETRIGERGVRLSGGQRQRLGIARALYSDPSVLVLDEATSALDGITEESIFQAVNELAKAKTIIMIAHRVTTVRDCDVIYFLEHGTISDYGTYTELLRRNSTFQSMAQIDPAEFDLDADSLPAVQG